MRRQRTKFLPNQRGCLLERLNRASLPTKMTCNTATDKTNWTLDVWLWPSKHFQAIIIFLK